MRATRRGIVKASLVFAVGAPVVALARQATPPSATPGASPAASPAATPGTGGGPADVVIQIVDFRFEPASVEVAVGTTVTWMNAGRTIHNTVAEDDSWNSDILQAGSSFSYTVTEPGTVPYLCTVHPNMKAELIVT